MKTLLGTWIYENESSINIHKKLIFHFQVSQSLFHLQHERLSRANSITKTTKLKANKLLAAACVGVLDLWFIWHHTVRLWLCSIYRTSLMTKGLLLCCKEILPSNGNVIGSAQVLLMDFLLLLLFRLGSFYILLRDGLMALNTKLGKAGKYYFSLCNVWIRDCFCSRPN